MKNESIVVTVLSYCWTVLGNVVLLFLVMFMYGAIQGPFQTIVLSLLVYLCMNVSYGFAALGWVKTKELFAFSEEFKRIRVLLHEEALEGSEDSASDQLTEQKRIFKKQTVKLYINLGFYLIFFVLILFNVLGVL